MRPIIDDSDSDEDVPLVHLKQKSNENTTDEVKKEAISSPGREAAGGAATHVVAKGEIAPGASNVQNGQHTASFNGVKKESASEPVKADIPPRPSVQPGANGLPQRTPAVKPEVKKEEDDSSSDSDDDVPLAKRIVALSRTIKGS